MSDQSATTKTGANPIDTKDYVSMILADQLFGIPVLTVHDVLGPQRITRIPLAPWTGTPCPVWTWRR